MQKNRNKILQQATIKAILLNSALAILKFILFFFTSSISILADALNNLGDSTSCVISLIGTKLANKPSDKMHPHGHGRIEYISALIISIILFIVGAEFMKFSIEKIISPTPLRFSSLSIFFILLSIAVKIYMAINFKKLAKEYHSLNLKAQYKDYLGDILITSVILISMLVYKYAHITIDGYLGVVISFIILYSGYELISDTLSEIIGKVPDDFVSGIEQKILSYDKVLGVHDIIVANYGVEKIYVTADVEMSYQLSLVAAHKIIDKIENDINSEFGCTLSIHIDPVGDFSEEEELVRNLLEIFMTNDSRIQSFHDLSYIDNVVKVDIVVDGNQLTEKDATLLKQELIERLSSHIPHHYDITMDRYFY